MNKFKTTAKSFVKPQTIYSSYSKINGDIHVIEQFGRRELIIGDLQQSGDLVAQLWDKAIKKLSNEDGEQKILILGLGAGSVVRVINKHIPKAQITGVEIDQEVVHVAKKFFDLDTYSNLTVKTEDAVRYISKVSDVYDILLVDMYQGENIPEQVYSSEFMHVIKKRLKPSGRVLINHLRGTRYDTKRMQLETMLNKEFGSVKAVQPLVNTVYICSMVS